MVDEGLDAGLPSPPCCFCFWLRNRSDACRLVMSRCMWP